MRVWNKKFERGIPSHGWEMVIDPFRLYLWGVYKNEDSGREICTLAETLWYINAKNKTLQKHAPQVCQLKAICDESLSECATTREQKGRIFGGTKYINWSVGGGRKQWQVLEHKWKFHQEAKCTLCKNKLSLYHLAWPFSSWNVLKTVGSCFSLVFRLGGSALCAGEVWL